MRAGVISDTHGNTTMLKSVLTGAGKVDCWFHAGDYSWDAECLAKWSNLPVTVAAGNCDGRGVTARLDVYTKLDDKLIWLTHGHRYGVKYGLEELLVWGRQYGADVVIFGHTHVPYCRWHDNMLLLNPGSLACSRVGSPTYALLEIQDGQVKAEIRELSVNCMSDE